MFTAQEFGLYYLQSRYYDPEVGRFLNADVYTSTGQGMLGNNMFAYCRNNPIRYIDPSGYLSENLSHTCFVDLKGSAGGDLCAGGGGVLLLPALLEVGDDVAALVIATVTTLSATTERNTHHIYLLVDPLENDIVKYVGRTNDPGRRLREHQNDPKHPERAEYEMRVVMSGLTLDQAKLYEQLLISAFTLSHLENARREIAVGNIASYRQYLGAAEEVFCGATEDALWRLLGG